MTVTRNENGVTVLGLNMAAKKMPNGYHPYRKRGTIHQDLRYELFMMPVPFITHHNERD